MSKKRVVITGTGLLTPSGKSTEEFFDNLSNGRSGLTEIRKTGEYKGLDVNMYGKINNWDPDKYITKREKKRMNPNGWYLMYSAMNALKDSGLDIEKIDPARAGVIMGAAFSGLEYLEQQYTKYKNNGGKAISSLMIPILSPNVMVSMVAIKYNFMGSAYILNSACSSSNIAFGDSIDKIRSGRLDICLTGGVDCEMSPFELHGFNKMRALSKSEGIRASRPFTGDRDGFVLSEGAGVLVFEELGHARKRGAQILAEVLGYGISSDAYHITAPHPEGEGAYLAMKNSLKDADLNLEDIDYINAHGTSTYYNDRTEVIALKRLFKDKIYDIPVSSTKSMTGHLLAGAGAIEAIAGLLPIIRNIIPPTINYDNKDPELDLDFVPDKAREKKVNTVMLNSFGFGGQNGVVILKKYK